MACLGGDRFRKDNSRGIFADKVLSDLSPPSFVLDVYVLKLFGGLGKTIFP